ncbi:MAG: amidohydrolase family protein [Gammaproteobacteria bacterium]|nr:amidohydrolase family protein [Gammaproteobacteria bacterium]
MKMKRLVLTLSVMLFAASGEFTLAEDTVIRNAQVLTMLDGPEYRRMDVVTRDGVFVDGVRAEGATVIDASGKFVIPGLTEMHAHVPVVRFDQGAERYREDVLFLWVANGVTLARGMMGHPSHLELRGALEANEVVGPRLITSGPSFSGRDRTVAGASNRVREQQAAGYDLLKIHPGLPPDVFHAVASAANEVGIEFSGHVTGSIGLIASLEAGQRTIDHLDGFIETLVDPERLSNRNPTWFGADLAYDVNETRIEATLDALLESGAALVPTETLLENVAGSLEELQARDEFAYLPPNLRTGYSNAVRGSANAFTPDSAKTFLDLRKRLIGAAFRGGVPVLLGSDSPQIFNVPGFSIHHELQAMAEAGLSPFEAIATGTTAPAVFYGQDDLWGSIAPGRSADLIVLRNDPLLDIGNTRSIDAVMVRGRFLSREELDAGLKDIRERYRSPTEDA